MIGPRDRVAAVLPFARLIVTSTVEVLTASVDTGSRANARDATAALQERKAVLDIPFPPVAPDARNSHDLPVPAGPRGAVTVPQVRLRATPAFGSSHPCTNA